MVNRLFFSVAAAGVLASQSAAGNMQPVTTFKDWTWISSVSAGAVWGKNGETQAFNLAPEILKMYVARKSTNSFATGEFFVGIQKLLSSHWLGQLGVAVAASSNTKLQGEIWDDADPQFDNYSYKYSVRNTRVALKGKLLFDNPYKFMPWVSVSLGAGFNRANNYINRPLIFEVLADANFVDNTKTAFTYTLGFGVQKALDDHWQLGVGYEFADWGKSELSPAFMQTMNSGLTLKHLYTNAVLVNVGYLA